MSKYINAETLIDMLNAKADMALGTPKAVFGNVIKMIDLLPPADVVTVVRCKDCKHLMFSDMYGECSQAHMGIVRPDDFCSYGERKENND
jgi:hypothetical protein